MGRLLCRWHWIRDRCSQAFPVFRALPLLCIILNANRRTKKKKKKLRRPGNEATSRAIYSICKLTVCLCYILYVLKTIIDSSSRMPAEELGGPSPVPDGSYPLRLDYTRYTLSVTANVLDMMIVPTDLRWSHTYTAPTWRFFFFFFFFLFLFIKLYVT